MRTNNCNFDKTSKSKVKRVVFLLCSILVMLCTISLGADVQKNNEIEALFEKKHEAWKQFMDSPQSKVLSDSTGTTTRYFKEIVELGVPALPYIIEKMGEEPTLWVAVRIITKKQLHITRTGQRPKEFRWTVEEFPNMKDLDKRPAMNNLFLRWWKEGAIHISQQFEKFYQEWKKLNQEGKETEAKAKYQKMIELGVAALPYMIERVKQGDTELIPMISELTDTKIKKDTKESECLDWWEKNKQKWLIPFPDIKADNTATHKDQPGAEEPNES